MTYASLRGTIKTGDVLAFSGKGVFSRLIQWRTKSIYSHVATLIWITPNQTPRLMIDHALYPNGASLMFASEYLKRYNGEVHLYRLQVTDEFRQSMPDYEKQIADFLAQKSGMAYDIEGVLRFIAPIFRNSASAHFCSERVSLMLNHFGFTQETQVSPGQLVRQPILKGPTVLS